MRRAFARMAYWYGMVLVHHIDVLELLVFSRKEVAERN